MNAEEFTQRFVNHFANLLQRQHGWPEENAREEAEGEEIEQDCIDPEWQDKPKAIADESYKIWLKAVGGKDEAEWVRVHRAMNTMVIHEV